MKNSMSIKNGREQSKPAAATKAKSPSIRIVLADDHHVVRQGMAAIIATERDLKIVAPVAAIMAVIWQNGIIEKDI